MFDKDPKTLPPKKRPISVTSYTLEELPPKKRHRDKHEPCSTSDSYTVQNTNNDRKLDQSSIKPTTRFRIQHSRGHCIDFYPALFEKDTHQLMNKVLENGKELGKKTIQKEINNASSPDEEKRLKYRQKDFEEFDPTDRYIAKEEEGSKKVKTQANYNPFYKNPFAFGSVTVHVAYSRPGQQTIHRQSCAMPIYTFSPTQRHNYCNASHQNEPNAPQNSLAAIKRGKKIIENTRPEDMRAYNDTIDRFNDRQYSDKDLDTSYHAEQVLLGALDPTKNPSLIKKHATTLKRHFESPRKFGRNVQWQNVSVPLVSLHIASSQAPCVNCEMRLIGEMNQPEGMIQRYARALVKELGANPSPTDYNILTRVGYIKSSMGTTTTSAAVPSIKPFQAQERSNNHHGNPQITADAPTQTNNRIFCSRITNAPWGDPDRNLHREKYGTLFTSDNKKDGQLSGPTPKELSQCITDARNSFLELKADALQRRDRTASRIR